MEKNINVKKILKGLKTNEFVLGSRMPMGYGFGCPLLQVRNDYLCLVVPFLKYQTTGEVDKTLVYPIRNTFTISLPDETMVGFEDLRFNEKFSKIDFSKPIGFFRHESIKNLTKKEYDALRNELFESYDKLISSLLYDTEYTDADDARMGELIRILVEPSLYPIYRALDIDFYNKYFA